MKTITTTKKSTDISPPIYQVYHMLRAFLGADQDITVEVNEKSKYLNVIISDASKYKAYLTILKDKINDFEIRVNGKKRTAKYTPTTESITAALITHPMINDIQEIEVLGFRRLFIMFKQNVVQYYDDNFSHPYGLVTTIAEDLARKIFTIPGVCICTK